MPQSYLAWPLALERPRFFSCQHPTAVPLSPPSLLIAWSWRLFRASSNLEAWSQVMNNWSRKSLRGSLRQGKLLEDSTTGCSHTAMCPWTQSWKSTDLLSLHHCSITVSPWLSTAATSSSWRSSICEHSIPSWVSNGRIKSSISKSWTKPNQPLLKWCCWKPSSTGLTMSSGWATSTCQSSCSLVK